MAFYDYIILDGHWYRTTSKTWHPEEVVPSTSRPMLDGNLDVTFGKVTLVEWNGEIVGPVTADATMHGGIGNGTIEDLRVSLRKRQTLSFTDHYGSAFTVHAIGPFVERSLGPDWQAHSNVVYVKAKLRGKR